MTIDQLMVILETNNFVVPGKSELLREHILKLDGLPHPVHPEQPAPVVGKAVPVVVKPVPVVPVPAPVPPASPYVAPIQSK